MLQQKDNIIPGFINGHSHAFQYAMAGLAETLAPGRDKDDFWVWRSSMYHLAALITPDDAYTIAAMAYAEMLRFGYTEVVEFHYLHHDYHGKLYADPSVMAQAHIAAASDVGIRMCMVPVFYQLGDFDKPALPEQKRFLFSNLDSYFEFSADIDTRCRAVGFKSGRGVHSLRAASAADVMSILSDETYKGPLHLHIAEQQKEVKSCEAARGASPVRWLLDHVKLGAHHILTHATHMDDLETAELAASGATVVICPSTEGNLGDGFFPFEDFVAAGGRWSIGSDSHINLNPLEELRWLDYICRMRAQRRNPFSKTAGEERGTQMLMSAYDGGNHAAGHFSARSDKDVDTIVLDMDHPALMERPGHKLSSSFVYAADVTAIKSVHVNGKVVIEDGQHKNIVALKRDFAKVLKKFNQRFTK